MHFAQLFFHIKFQARSAAVGDDAILSAAAGSTSVPGSYAIEVIDLAQAHKLRSADGAFAAVTDVVGAGTLLIDATRRQAAMLQFHLGKLMGIKPKG